MSKSNTGMLVLGALGIGALFLLARKSTTKASVPQQPLAESPKPPEGDAFQVNHPVITPTSTQTQSPIPDNAQVVPVSLGVVKWS